MSDSPEPVAKPKHQRRTKAEREEIRQAEIKAEADKPIDPVVWIVLGAVLLVIAFFVFLDPSNLVGNQTRGTEGVQIVLVILYAVLGKNLATILLGGFGGLSLIVGIIGWIRKRFSRTDSS